MDVIWTQEALERLKDIQYYLAVQEKAPQAARDTLERIFAQESQIQEMPLSGRIVPDYKIANLFASALAANRLRVCAGLNVGTSTTPYSVALSS